MKELQFFSQYFGAEPVKKKHPVGRETKDSLFASRAQDYLFTAFVARVAKILTYALGENYSGSTQVLSLRIGESPPSYVTLCGASSPNDLIRNLLWHSLLPMERRREPNPAFFLREFSVTM